MSSNGSLSVPEAPPDSPGSSVSSHLMEEYEELLKYAVVVPAYDPSGTKKVLTDAKNSFPQLPRKTQAYNTELSQGQEIESDTEVIVKVTRENGPAMDQLPDFGQSPITSEGKKSDGAKESSLVIEEEGVRPSATRSQQQHSQNNSDEARIPEPLFKNTSQSLFKDLDMSNNSATYRQQEELYRVTTDVDVEGMERVLDHWSQELKRNVMAQLMDTKLKVIQQQRSIILKEQETNASERAKLVTEMESLKELLHTYEVSMKRKDEVISNMTQALARQREKQEVQKKFTEWKIQHLNQKREEFCSKLAAKHYNRSVVQRVWDGWHSVIENKWRTRVEKACQAKAQEVCVQLTNSYESKIASLTEQLEISRMEVEKLHQQREQYEEAMKKAFMRGVCALNLEAMSIFQQPGDRKDDETEGREPDYTSNMEDSLPPKDEAAPKTIPTEEVYSSQPVRSCPPAKTVGIRPTTSSSSSGGTKSSVCKSFKSKSVSAKVISRSEKGRPASGTLAPPMSSVIVERHQPVTKETLPHATAAKHPSQQRSVGGVHRKLAGQGSLSGPSPHIQTVKVVD